MKLLRNLAMFVFGSAALFSCAADTTTTDPTPGSTKSVTIPVSYSTKILTPATGNWAVFPTVKFPTDSKAKSYKVRLFGFTGTFASPPEGKIYTWDTGELPPTPYNIYKETFDIKDGYQYMVFGRTWCGGACDSTSVIPWIENYKKGYGPDPMGEVTYQY